MEIKKILKTIIIVTLIAIFCVVCLFVVGTYILFHKGLAFINTRNKVAEVAISLPDWGALSSVNSTQYMNSLMLSPFWYVHDENGRSLASARSFDVRVDDYDQTDDDYFLFENIDPILKNQDVNSIVIRNGGIADSTGSRKIDAYTSTPAYIYSLEVNIVNRKLKGSQTLCNVPSQTCQLEVYKRGEQFSSTLILPLNSDLYLEIKEDSPDQKRVRTQRIINNLSAELLNYSTPEKTCLAMNDQNNTYSSFLRTLFQKMDHPAYIERGPGSQDRFTFYGYIKPDLLKDSHSPITIKISNPEICLDECTNSSRRAWDAEYVGGLHCQGLPHFFSIEDNAIYLAGKYNSQYGHFSGKEHFSADVSVMQAEALLHAQNFDGFTGWER